MYVETTVEIFNALVEKIEILTPAYFVFELMHLLASPQGFMLCVMIEKVQKFTIGW